MHVAFQNELPSQPAIFLNDKIKQPNPNLPTAETCAMTSAGIPLQSLFRGIPDVYWHQTPASVLMHLTVATHSDGNYTYASTADTDNPNCKCPCANYR